MKNDKKINNEERVTDVKGTIVGFVAPETIEQTQEQEIQDFKLKKQNEKELAKLSDEEQKKKREEYEEEKEKLEKVKTELLKSIKERIPAIEKRFKVVEPTVRRGKVVEKINSKSREKTNEIESNVQPNHDKDENERE